MAADPCPGKNTPRANPGCRPAASGDEPWDPVRREEAQDDLARQAAAVGSNGWRAADGFAARRWEAVGDDWSFSWWEIFDFPLRAASPPGHKKAPPVRHRRGESRKDDQYPRGAPAATTDRTDDETLIGVCLSVGLCLV